MSAEPYQLYYVGFLIPPYQQCVVFHIAFHMSTIIARQGMRSIFIRYRQLILKQSKNVLQFLNNLRPIFISLEILLKLSSYLQSLHRESTKLRKLERSSVSKLSEVSASFIAAKVVLLGFSETKASNTLSTRLLRLRLCFLASTWRRSSKFDFGRARSHGDKI